MGVDDSSEPYEYLNDIQKTRDFSRSGIKDGDFVTALRRIIIANSAICTKYTLLIHVVRPKSTKQIDRTGGGDIRYTKSIYAIRTERANTKIYNRPIIVW